MKRKSKIALVFAALLVTAACIHKTGGAVTPWEKVTTYNAALAQANNTTEQGAEAVVSADLLTPQQAAPLIGATGRVATLHLQVTALLAQGSVTQANIDSISALVDEAKAAVNAIPPAALGFKNPKSAQTFQADFNAIYTLADALLASLKGVVK